MFLRSLVLIYVLVLFALSTLSYWIIEKSNEQSSRIFIDIAGYKFPEIQEQDYYFHNIDNVMDDVKNADILIIGPSFSLYGFNDDLLTQFSNETGYKIYNLSFLGIRGGDFVIDILRKYKITPKYLIVNVDDQIISFFDRSYDLTFGSIRKKIDVIEYSAVHGFINYHKRLVRWAIQDAVFPGSNNAINSLKRNKSTGAIVFSKGDQYFSHAKNIKFNRIDSDCRPSDVIKKRASEFVNEFKVDSTVIFTGIPHSEFCKLQLHSLAADSGVILIDPINQHDEYNSLDGGGHLNYEGSTVFTQEFLKKLKNEIK